MHGANPIRPPVTGTGDRLDIKHLFATIQGEGPYAGRPAVFVRLGGCNLACDFCDTDFENDMPQALGDLLREVERLAANEQGARVRRLVVITGGEPLRQPIAPLCEALLARGFDVQIETNGTLFRPLPAAVQIVCSPKNSGKGYAPLRPDMLARADALKFIVSATRAGYGEVPEVGQSGRDIPIYVQPMDEGDEALNRRNRDYALALAQRFGYRLSLQIHKILNIP